MILRAFLFHSHTHSISKDFPIQWLSLRPFRRLLQTNPQSGTNADIITVGKATNVIDRAIIDDIDSSIVIILLLNINNF